MKCGLRSPNSASIRAALSLLILAGCAAPFASTTPTEAIITPPNLALPSATVVPTGATIIVDITNSAISIASIDILSPGDSSQVTSPIQLNARLQPGADGRVIVELRDEAGRILARQIQAIETTELEIELTFEVSRPTLPTQLSVRTLDAFGRTQALNSVELTLLSEGPAAIVPGSEQAHITLNQPVDGQSVSVNEITISGTTYVAGTRPLSIQLITREGRVLVSREVYPQGELSRPALFETVLAVSISEPTWVQVAVSAPGRNNLGPAHFTAVEVLLEP